MANRRKRLLCLTCAVALRPDDRTHYGFQCHACVIKEHDLVVELRRDPHHPDAVSLENGPVDIGWSRGGAESGSRGG